MKMGTIGPVTPSRDNPEEPLAADASETFWFWETDLRTNRMFCSAELNAFLGVEPDQQMTPEESLLYVHPEDRDRVRAALTNPDEDVQQAQVVYRVVTGSGAVRLVRARAQFIMDDRNQPVRVTGLVRDITDEAETARLMRSHALVMQGMRDAVTIIDSHGVIRDANPAAEAVLGRSRQELVGANTADLHELTKLSGIAGEEIAGSIQERGYWTGEYSFVRPDGTRVYAETTTYPIPDPESGKMGRVSITRDISKRKTTEEALRKNTHRLLDAHRIAKVGHWEYEAATDHVRMFGGIFDQFGVWGDESKFAFKETLATLHPGDQERVAAAYQRAVTEGVTFDEVYRTLSGEEGYLYIHGRGEPIRDDGGNVTGLRGTVLDVTEQRTAAEELRRSETRLLRAHRIAKISHWETDTATWRSTTFGEVLSGLGLEGDVSQEEVFALIHADDSERVRAALERSAKDGVPFDETYRVQNGDATIYIHAVGETVCNEAGKIISIRGTTQDISERVRAEQVARTSEDQTRAILENVADAVLTIDEGGIVLLANRAFETSFGYSTEEIKGQHVTAIMPESYRGKHTGSMKRYLGSGVGRVLGQGPAELEAMDKDGRVFPIELTISEAGIAGQRVFIGSIRDIGDRKEAEAALRESEARLRATMEGSLDGVYFHRAIRDDRGDIVDFEFVDVNERGLALVTLAREDLIGTRLSKSYPAAFENGLFDKLKTVLDTGAPLDEEMQALENVDAQWLHHQIVAYGDGVAFTVRDVTERKQANQELRKAQGRLSTAQRIAGLGTFELNLATGETIWSEEMFRIFDLDPEKDETLQVDHYFEHVHPEDRDGLREFIESALSPKTEDEFLDFENRIITKLGNEKTVLGFRKAQFDDQGNPTMLAGTIQDITALRQAEQQLQQAQKMETVGQLTGGIAHDFNNLLAVISGNLELAQARLPADSDLTKILEAAFRASQRGADLTGRLLAYSRRQILTPQPTDINELTEHMLILGRRTLGEAVEVVFEPAQEAWWAHVDPAQLENALLNLAINARDAMPDGGTLTIRTQNLSIEGEAVNASDALHAGDYVVVEVADTGTGMSEDVREKVFEPFFTTKDVGEGSGLGLSMVYGFVNQSGGHVDIESTVGEGTTIRLYLPRSEPANQDAPEEQAANLDVGSSDETVLVVEDDPHVRDLAVELVESLGYTVHEAGDAMSALEIMKSGTPVDLVLSDVILGKGMNGVELANQIREGYPKTKVLLMSGYAREAFRQEDGLGETYELISKPFSIADLAQNIDILLHS